MFIVAKQEAVYLASQSYETTRGLALHYYYVKLLYQIQILTSELIDVFHLYYVLSVCMRTFFTSTNELSINKCNVRTT